MGRDMQMDPMLVPLGDLKAKDKSFHSHKVSSTLGIAASFSPPLSCPKSFLAPSQAPFSLVNPKFKGCLCSILWKLLPARTLVRGARQAMLALAGAGALHEGRADSVCPCTPTAQCGRHGPLLPRDLSKTKHLRPGREGRSSLSSGAFQAALPSNIFTPALFSLCVEQHTVFHSL